MQFFSFESVYNNSIRCWKESDSYSLFFITWNKTVQVKFSKINFSHSYNVYIPL